MKKFLVSLAIASSALVASAPASAQYYGQDRQDRRYDDRGDYGYDRQDDRGYRNDNIRQRLERIDFRIERGVERGALTRGEAQRLRHELRNVSRMAQRYSHDGLNGWERGDLERRINWLQQRVRFERQDNDRRYYR